MEQSGDTVAVPMRDARVVGAVEYKARPWTTNAERRMSFYKKGRLVKEWREMFAMLAKIEKLQTGYDQVMVVAETHLKDHRHQDVGACFPAVKAAIDGLVDYGLIPSDDPQHVRGLMFEAPVCGTYDGLRLRIYTQRPVYVCRRGR